MVGSARNATVPEEKDKPVFDEQTLAKLLEAAYVLQEHSQELKALQAELGLPRKQAEAGAKAVSEAATQATAKQTNHSPSGSKPAPGASSSSERKNPDYTTVLAQIAELQFQVEDRHLEPDQTMALVAEHVIEICGAAGAAIGLSNGTKICYLAVAGIRTLPLGSSVPLAKALCFPCLRTGQVFRCPDVDAQPPIDTHECRRRGIGSLIAAPVFRGQGAAGGLELYFSDPNAFGEEDVQTCQMLAGIISQNLEQHAQPADSDPSPGAVVAKPPDSQGSLPAVRCYKCGNELIGEEQFCGQCGAPRSRNSQPQGIQSKVASLWHTQGLGDSPIDSARANLTAKRTGFATMSNAPSLIPENPILRALEEEIGTSLETAHDSENRAESSSVAGTEQVEQQLQLNEQPRDTASDVSSKPESIVAGDWSSALSAREFLEQVARGSRSRRLIKFWNEHRGDIYLGIAIVLVICVIRWGLWAHRPAKPTPPAATQAAQHKPAAPQLSLFDRMLVSMGLAEAPDPPEDKGNPSTTVWVDLHTGLYYCPGTDMYGKSVKGKFASQRDAQLDQFTPAYRKVCD
jgi:GAF domain-containing protein